MEDKILQAIDGLSKQIARLAEQVENQGDQITTMSGKVENQGDQITTMSEKIEYQGFQIKENTQILKVLEHLAQVNKAEHDKMSFEIAEIDGVIKAFGKSLSNIELITASNWGDIVRLKGIR